MFAGALSRHKGIHILLQAYQDLRSPVPLVLVGLPTHEPLPKLPAGVMLATNVPHKDVLAAWHYSTLAVVPSRWPDPCPLVALEAMAAGRPIVASAAGGLVDLVTDQETGLLVPPNDPLALAHAISRLLDNPQLRSQMGVAARHRAQAFRASSVVPRIEAVYRQAMADTPTARLSNA
jgi:glycosyltransferase involved in cell wall biosynthesis